MSERVAARSGVPIAAQLYDALAPNIIGTFEGSRQRWPIMQPTARHSLPLWTRS